MRTCSRAAQKRIYLYDLNVFKKDRLHADHMQEEHGMPAWLWIEQFFSEQNAETAFNGAVRVYDIVLLENEVELLALFENNRE